MSLSRHLAAQWSKLVFQKAERHIFKIYLLLQFSSYSIQPLQGSTYILCEKKYDSIFWIFKFSDFFSDFSKLFVGRVQKTWFFRIFWPRKNFWVKKSEMSNHTFLPTRLVKIGAKSVACTMKTEGGDTLWVSKTYARIRAGRHAGRGVVRLADVDFFGKISNFMVKWY